MVICVSALCVSAFGASPTAASTPELIIQRSKGLPVTAMNLTFRVGSADDPKGLEGMAALTARLLREGGMKEAPALVAGGPVRPAHSRSELEELLFPLAAEIGVSLDKEQISFSVLTTGADSELVFGLLAQLVTAPAFDSGELERLRGETLDALQKQLPRENEEELGKAALERVLYGATHPYGHAVEGTVTGLRAIDLDALKEFYRSHFTRRRLTVGLAGVVSPALEAAARSAFGALEEGETSHAEIPEAPTPETVRLTIVKGPFEAIGAHLGQALPLNRASADFPGMYLASWAFGKHRSFVGRLMNHVRETRGLNYGTYSYVESFPHGGARMVEPTQVSRTRQAFTVWARPTPLPNGCFLLRQIAREAGLVATEGVTGPEFALTKSHLIGNAPLLATGLERRLGYAIDSSFYGIRGDYLVSLQRAAEGLTRERVNGALKKYLHPATYQLVVVTPDPAKFKAEALSDSCVIHYPAGITKPAPVVREDGQIAKFSLGLTPDRIDVLDAESLFDK